MLDKADNAGNYIPKFHVTSGSCKICFGPRREPVLRQNLRVQNYVIDIICETV